MKFSIITATYNQGHNLPELAEALSRQTLQDFEWLICDDGSTDSTEEVVKNLEVPFPVRYFRQEHKGMRLAKNVNQGIQNANGEYCMFIFADSIPEINYLEVMDSHAGDRKILCGLRIHIDNGVGVDIDYRLKKGFIPNDNVMLVQKPWSLIAGNGLLIPTEAMREHGGWLESIVGYGGEDNEVVARLFYKGYTIWSIIDAKLYHRYHRSRADHVGNVDKVWTLIHSYYYGK